MLLDKGENILYLSHKIPEMDLLFQVLVGDLGRRSRSRNNNRLEQNESKRTEKCGIVTDIHGGSCADSSGLR